MGGGGSGSSQSGSPIYLNRKGTIVCSLKCTSNHMQCTCQAGTVTDSSLTPSVALFVCPSGTVHSIVDCHEFTCKVTKMMAVKADLTHFTI